MSDEWSCYVAAMDFLAAGLYACWLQMLAGQGWKISEGWLCSCFDDRKIPMAR
jgi:hypothetical protein